MSPDFRTVSVIRACSWCHTGNEIHGVDKPRCSTCGHRADVAMSQCDCPKCTADASARETERQHDMKELLRRFDAAGGDLGKVLDQEEYGGES